MEIDHTSRTEHGDNVANQIPGADVYGYEGLITLADLWHIVDQVHTNWCDKLPNDKEKHKLLKMLTGWMDEVQNLNPEIETV